MSNPSEDIINIICKGIEKWSFITMIPITGKYLEVPQKISYKTRNPWYV